jgi:hypothetical protein
MSKVVTSLCAQAAALQKVGRGSIDPDEWVLEEIHFDSFPVIEPRPPPPVPPDPPVPPIGPTLVPVTAWGSAEAYWWCTLLRANSVANGDDSFVQETIATRGPKRNYSFRWAGPAGLVPTVWWCQMEDRFCVGVNGTENSVQATQFFLTHAVGDQTVVAGGYFNATFAQSAATLYALVNPDFEAAGKPPLLVLGHSYGGGVAHPLYLALRGADPAPLDRLVVAGAPRTATVQSVPLFDQVQLIRFANDGDPVPILPPPRGFVLTSRLSPGANAYPGGDYVPLGGQLQPQVMGGIVPVPDPAYSYITWTEKFIDFLANGAQCEPHYAREYARRAETWFYRFPSQLQTEYASIHTLVNINALMATQGF